RGWRLQLRPGDRLGLVPLVHVPDLLAAEAAIRSDAELRSGYHPADGGRAGGAVPDSAEAVCLDGADARGAAEDESAAGSLQGRQAAPAAGDGQALQGREGQSACRLSADLPADPDLLRALQGAADRD